MARKKGRYNAVEERQASAGKAAGNGTFLCGGSDSGIPAHNTYRVALYARISAEHRDRDSDSLESQFLLLEDYVKKRPELSCYREFSDRNYSGTNFNRPGFQEMMAEIREGKINCVIVKDLSRLGRDYLESGNYIETIFPFLGVRFISINDHFDTEESENANKALGVSLMNLVNDMYARDISRKMTCTTRANIRRGSFVGSSAPYGYRVTETENGYGFVVDEAAAGIVQKIFEWYLELGNLNALARKLTQERIRTPGEYLKIPEIYLDENEKQKVWDVSTVEGILRREAYLGHMVQGKTVQHRYEGIEKTKVEPENWIKVEHTHEPIISEEIFRRVNGLLAANERKCVSRKQEIPMEADLFENLIYCPVCGKKIRQVSSLKKNGTKRNYYYFCNHKFLPNAGDYENCTIARYELLDVVWKVIQDAVRCLPVEPSVLLEQLGEKVQKENAEYRRRDRAISAKLKSLETEGMEQYQNYVTGMISKEEFQSKNRKTEERKAVLKQEMAALKEEELEQKKSRKDMEKWLAGFLKCEGRELPDRELLLALIKRIYLYPGRKLLVEFTFGGNTEAHADKGGTGKGAGTE
jgi:DNA invertase Pin-like site-specific DNA recombinase